MARAICTSLVLSALLYLFTVQHLAMSVESAAPTPEENNNSNNVDEDVYRNLLLNQLQSELETSDGSDPSGFVDHFPPQMYGLVKRKGGSSFCLRRGASCDNHPNDCCYKSSCRCNLWGVNCRCSRIGLLQKFL